METKNWKQSYVVPNELLSYRSHHFGVMNYENRVMSYGNHSSKQHFKYFAVANSKDKFGCTYFENGVVLDNFAYCFKKNIIQSLQEWKKGIQTLDLLYES